MARTRNLEVVISGDAKDLERAFKRTGDAADREGRRLHGFASVTSKGFSRVGVAATSMGAIAGGAIAVFAKSTVQAASDVNESLTKNQVLFGRYAKDVEAFSRTSATAFGISRKAALEYTGIFGNLFNALGISNRESAKFSVRLTKLAADMASFNNTSIDDALEAIRSGLVGETEPLRRFGVNLNDATLRQQALSMGLTHTTKNVLTPYQRSLAAQALIVKQTAAAHGDFRRTQGGLANQTRILQARFSDLKVSLGSALLPVVNDGAKALNRFITQMQRGTGAGGAFAREIRKSANDFRNLYEAGQSVYRGGQRVNSWLQAADRAVGRLDASINRGLIAAFRALRDAAAAVGDRLNRWIIQPLTKIVSAATRVIGAFGKLGSAFGAVGGAAKGAAGALNPFGDGIGLPSIPNLTGVGAGNLMGAQPALAPFAAVGSRFGLHVSSGRRPGSITSSGNVSYHSSGEAIDEAGSPAGMLGFFRYMKSRFGSRLAELIYTPGGVGVKDGRPFRYTGQVAADHFDHVHVAYDTGRPGVGDGTGRNLSGINLAIDAARKAGFSGDSLVRIVAIAGRESNYNPRAQNLKYPDHSIGLTQVNQLAWKGRFGSDAALMNPYTNMRAAWVISGHGRNFGPWSTNRGLSQGLLGQARAAVRAFKGGGGAAPGVSAGGVGASGAAADTTNPYELAIAGSDVEIAEAQQGGVVRGAGGRVVSSPALRETAAQKARLGIVNRRIGKVRAALKRHLRPATRLRLRQELAQLLGERSTITGRVSELAQLPETDTATTGDSTGTGTGGDGGGGEETDAQRAMREAIEANTRAQEEAAQAAREHALAVADLQVEMKRQTDFAASVQSTEAFQLKKYLADVLSGQIGGYGVVPRSYTPGSSGVAHAY